MSVLSLVAKQPPKTFKVYYTTVYKSIISKYMNQKLAVRLECLSHLMYIQTIYNKFSQFLVVNKISKSFGEL